MLVMTNDQVKADPLFYSLQVSTCFLDTTGSLVEQMHLRWVEGNKSCIVKQLNLSQILGPVQGVRMYKCSQHYNTLLIAHLL